MLHLKSKKTIIFSSFLVIVLVLLFIFKISAKKEANQNHFIVTRMDIVESIYENGTIKKGEEVNLSFESSGEIKKILISENDRVKKGDVLVELDNQELKFQLAEAKAELSAHKAQLNKLLNGPTEKEISIAKTKIEDAQQKYQNAKVSLEKAEDVANKSLENYYHSTISYLNDYIERLLNAKQFLSYYQRTYFNRSDQESIIVDYKKRDLEKIYQDSLEYIGKIKEDKSLIETYLQIVKDEIGQAEKDLDVVKELTDSPTYRNIISSVDKSSLDNHRYYISLSYNNINNAISSIRLQKSLNDQSLTKARSALDSALYNLQIAQKEYEKLIAKPREEDVNYLNSQIELVKRKIDLLNYRISKRQIIAPFDGVILKILKEKGESVRALEPIVVFLSSGSYYVEANIYEEDIPKIKIGSNVLINPVAYPERNISGKVYFISNKDVLINDVVYYPIKISLEDSSGLKPGMSADLTIIVEKRENVLAIPKDAVQEEKNKKFVWLKSKSGKIKRYIQTGIIGSDDFIEIIDGLKEGDEIIF